MEAIFDITKFYIKIITFYGNMSLVDLQRPAKICHINITNLVDLQGFLHA